MDRIIQLTICLSLVFLFLLPLEINAGMYKWKDRNGVTHFSDELPVDRQQAASEVETFNSAGTDEGVVINRFGMKFRFIKPGEFIMGSMYTKCCDGLIKKQLDDYGWYWNNSGDRTHPVAQKKPNRWGLYDMHGNVWEYCQDGYESYYYASKKPVNDPIIKPNSRIHVLRSGSFRHCPNACWSASRCKDSPSGKAAETTGFRLVMVAAE